MISKTKIWIPVAILCVVIVGVVFLYPREKTKKMPDVSFYEKYEGQSYTLKGYKISLRYGIYSEIIKTGEAVFEVENLNNPKDDLGFREGETINSFGSDNIYIEIVTSGTKSTQGYHKDGKNYLVTKFEVHPMEAVDMERLEKGQLCVMFGELDEVADSFGYPFKLRDSVAGKKVQVAPNLTVGVSPLGVCVESDKKLDKCTIKVKLKNGRTKILFQINGNSKLGVYSESYLEDEPLVKYRYTNCFRKRLKINQCETFYYNDSEIKMNTSKSTNKIESVSNERIHIKDNRIISIDNLYEKEEKLVIPEGITGIESTALKYKKKGQNEQGAIFTTSQTLHICFSNKVKLKEKNFVGAGPLDISFEEGREKIERNVFREAGCNGRCFNVTLPNSCKVIEDYAFYHYQGKLQLNEGLERIEAYALSGTTCDLPDSVEYLGEHALEEWSPKKYTSTSKTADIKNFRLPSSLKYIGNECIELTDLYPGNIVVIPKSVKKIGKNAFRYLTSADVPKKRMPHVRYKVAKGNKWFYSDKDGKIHKIPA